MKVVNYTELRLRLKYYLDATEDEEIIISRDNNRKSCVLISLDEYNKLTNTDNNGWKFSKFREIRK